jgi:anti-anti-sigma factor
MPSIRSLSPDEHPHFSLSDRAVDDGLHVITPSGEIDIVTAPDFKARLMMVIDRGARRVVVDLSAVPFMDSSGLNALITAQRRASATGAVVALAGMDPNLRKVLELTGLHEVFAIYDSVDAAAREAGD